MYRMVPAGVRANCLCFCHHSSTCHVCFVAVRCNGVNMEDRHSSSTLRHHSPNSPHPRLSLCPPLARFLIPPTSLTAPAFLPDGPPSNIYLHALSSDAARSSSAGATPAPPVVGRRRGPSFHCRHFCQRPQVLCDGSGFFGPSMDPLDLQWSC